MTAAPPAVLQVCEPPDGGVAEYVLRLSQGLRARGWRVDVACPSPSWLATRLAEDGIRVVPVALTRPPRARGSLSSLVRLARLIARGGYDVVHLHSSKAGAIGRLAARLGRTPSVFTPNAWSFLAAGTAPARWACVLAERAGARLGDSVICVSRDERRAGLQARVIDAPSCAVIPNGVALPVAPARPAPGSGPPTVGTIARLSRQKGIDVLLDAARIVLDAMPEARVIVAGGGPLEGELRAQAARLGIADSVDLLGEVAEARSLLDGFDVFALPSRWEGMSFALLEACAAGLPCVATDVGGASEVIRDGVEGRIVPPEDSRALAEALLQALADPALRARWGEAARARVERDFGVAKMVSRTELHYLRTALRPLGVAA